MIAANIAAAIAIERARRPFLYRAHEVPPPDKLEPFRDFVDSLGIRSAKGTHHSSAGFVNFLHRQKKTASAEWSATQFSMSGSG